MPIYVYESGGYRDEIWVRLEDDIAYIKETIGREIVAAREATRDHTDSKKDKLSQYRLATLTPHDRAVLCRAEAGEQFSWQVALAVAAVLDIPFGRLFRRVKPKRLTLTTLHARKDEEENAVIERFRARKAQRDEQIAQALPWEMERLTAKGVEPEENRRAFALARLQRQYRNAQHQLIALELDGVDRRVDWDVAQRRFVAYPDVSIKGATIK